MTCLKKIFSKITLVFLFLCIVSFTFSAETNKGNNYIKWLEEQSMLYQAGLLSETVSGKDIQWQHPYAEPQTEKIVETASVWFTAYPCSTITASGESILQTLGSEKLWQTFENIGIQAMHTGPMKKAGGIQGNKYTPTVDGWFDRISLEIDPLFGTDKEYEQLAQTAKKHSAIIIGDVIPGHTGKGADFRLAERGYKDYPGLYSMVEIDKKDWSLLPEVPEGKDTVNLSKDTVNKLKENGYIPGQLQRVLYSAPGKTDSTGWDATDIITGTDEKKRRWVYLHYFRPGQPTLNWLDPSFAANRLISGDIIKTHLILGAQVIRLDANSFLGIEIKPDSEKCWSEGHPLSVTSTEDIAWLMRKLGGWSFQELNLGLGEIKAFSENGPDLSYDFITRPAYDHALLTQDAGFLRLMLDLMQSYKIKPLQLIHALQNHDEITYELVHFIDHADEQFSLDGKELSGKDLRDKIIEQMHTLATAPRAPYNKLSGNGLCTTYTGLCAAAFGIKDPYSMTDEEIELVKKGHLVLVMFNALQPGVFALSGWDLVGALPLQEDKIKKLLADGDYRWINRGAYDIMGVNPDADASSYGIPKTQILYGTLPDQLKDPDSFALQLKKILEMRRNYKIALSELIAIPPVKNKGAIIMVHQLPENLGFSATAINFGRNAIQETIKVNELKGTNIINAFTNTAEGEVGDSGDFSFNMDALSGTVFIFHKD